MCNASQLSGLGASDELIRVDCGLFQVAAATAGSYSVSCTGVSLHEYQQQHIKLRSQDFEVCENGETQVLICGLLLVQMWHLSLAK